MVSLRKVMYARVIYACAASSSVPTFESAGEEFVKDMKAMGVTCLTCAEMSDKIQSKPPPQK